MIGASQTSTERLEPSIEEIIEEIIKEKEKLEQARPSEPSRTSSELQPFTLIPRIGLAYHPYLQILASQAYESLLRKITANYKELLDSILSTFQQEIWRETLSLYPASDLGALEQLYIFRRRSEVTKFLVDNPFLFPFLEEAHEQIRNYFGKSAQVVLEVITDPEVTGDRELVLFVRTSLSPDEAFKKLEQLGEEWWLDAPANARKKLCIDVEFE